MDFEAFIKEAVHVRPNDIQLKMLRETPFYMFVHFGTNTYTDLEWGDGTASPSVFNPEKLDCRQWAKAAVSAGMKGIVLTAKHHDGFCLWQSDYTDYCMKNSPYKQGRGDIVKECAEACREYGLKFGFYLSPWDRNSGYYGSDEYNTYYKNQLTELLTRYGEIFYVWFDGACGEGPNGKKQIYDFKGYIELIKKYQPQAAVFNDAGIIRWCGNEAGKAPFAQWCVVPSELCSMPEIQTGPGPFEGNIDFMYNSDPDIGSMSNIIYSKGLVFAPAEVDMSIRDGWFYHREQEPHSLERLVNTYINSAGNNSTFNLNVPPTPDGLLDDRDVMRLKELGDRLKELFSDNLAEDAVITQSCELGPTQPVFTVSLPEKRIINYVEIAENIAEGQRVESFSVLIKKESGEYSVEASSSTIGSRKILKLDSEETDTLRIRINSSRDVPDIEYIKLY